MTLKAVVETLDDIPEALKTEYIEKPDGKFHLDLDDTVQVHTSVLPLANSLRNVRAERQVLWTKTAELEARVAGLPDDFDPARYQSVLDELEALKADPNRDKDSEAKLTRIREQYESRIAAAETKRLADLKVVEDKNKGLETEIEEYLAGDGLTSALVKSGIAKEFLDASKALLKPNIKVKVDEATSKRKAVVDTDLGEVDVMTYVDNWAKSDVGKPFVSKGSGSGAPGSGNGGGTEINPWADKTKNLTAQGALIRSDRVKADRMMRAAGLTPLQISAALG